MTITSTWATRSSLRFTPARDSGMNLETSAMATSPTGTLTQKMLRQPTVPVSIPPRTGPSAMLTPNMVIQTPIAQARSAGPLKTLEIMDTATGLSIDPPIACSTRKAISQPRPGATEHNAELIVNTVSPARKTWRRPNRSAVAPADITRLASTIV